MDDKTFIGNVKEIETKYGSIYKLGINEDDINVLRDNLNDKGWVNVAVKTSKKGGLYMELDTYEAKQDTKQEQVQTAPRIEEDEIDLEEIPF